MEKFTPYEKLSKKTRRELDLKRRRGWGALNPLSRKTANAKLYNRKKTRRREDEGLFIFELTRKSKAA
ncbi:MAG: hypothetical protein Q4B42_05945 [Oscillospiraceae bacterium]|nr:hypothetical protein [Oscillospiraceae bacterium]